MSPKLGSLYSTSLLSFVIESQPSALSNGQTFDKEMGVTCILPVFDPKLQILLKYKTQEGSTENSRNCTSLPKYCVSI